MGTIVNIRSTQFSFETVESMPGVTLVYRADRKDSTSSYSAINFAGEEYTPENVNQDEVFRVWKNVVTTFWLVKAKEAGLRVNNDNITSKLRNSTPVEIFVRSANNMVKHWDIEKSVWSRIGLVPTKKELELSARDFKKRIHAATKASFDALKFRLNFQEIVETTINYYEVLNVAKDATVEEIKAAYREAVKKAHPDKGGSDAKIKEVNEAWETLKDAEKRAKYDESLAA